MKPLLKLFQLPVVTSLLSAFLVVFLPACKPQPMTQIPFDQAYIQRLGRTVLNADASLTFGYPGTGVRFRTDASQARVEALSTGDASYIGVRVDDGPVTRYTLGKSPLTITLLDNPDGQTHTVELLHHSETWHGKVTLNRLTLAGGELQAPASQPTRKLLVVGDSVTCGEGANRDQVRQCNKDTSWWNAHQSYGWLTGEALGADTQLVCYGGRGLIRSWNGATDELNGPDFYQLTLAEDGAPRWSQEDFQADVVVVSLGTNDFSLSIGPLPEMEAFVGAYVSFVKTLLQDHPRADIVLTDGAIVSDGDPERPQRTVLRRYLAETLNRVGSDRVHVFEASHFPGDQCDAHPTGPQHKKMSEELVAAIRTIKGW